MCFKRRWEVGTHQLFATCLLETFNSSSWGAASCDQRRSGCGWKRNAFGDHGFVSSSIVFLGTLFWIHCRFYRQDRRARLAFLGWHVRSCQDEGTYVCSIWLLVFHLVIVMCNNSFIYCRWCSRRMLLVLLQQLKCSMFLRLVDLTPKYLYRWTYFCAKKETSHGTEYIGPLLGLRKTQSCLGNLLLDACCSTKAPTGRQE